MNVFVCSTHAEVSATQLRVEGKLLMIIIIIIIYRLYTYLEGFMLFRSQGQSPRDAK